jgi:hypothetical protein
MDGHFPHQRKAGSRSIAARRFTAFLNISTAESQPHSGFVRSSITYSLNLLVVDFADASPILSKKQTAGEPQWLRVRCDAGDPLNLMRVMPPKGARVRSRTKNVSHACDRAWLFCFRQN